MTIPAYAAISDAPAEDRLAYAITEIARQSPESIAIVSGAGGDGRRAVNYSIRAFTAAFTTGLSEIQAANCSP